MLDSSNGTPAEGVSVKVEQLETTTDHGVHDDRSPYSVSLGLRDTSRMMERKVRWSVWFAGRQTLLTGIRREHLDDYVQTILMFFEKGLIASQPRRDSRILR